MRAVLLTRFGGPDVLEIRDVPAPEPGPREIQVRVRASALNRADLLQREGRYAAPPGAPADIPGLEFAGEVSALGDAATRWRVGDRVFGIVGGGGHAEYLVVDERAVAAIPGSLDWIEAAAVPEAFITAHDALVTQAGLRAGERVLIHAAGSGVGLAAVQIVRAIGAIPYGTSRTADKLDRARSFGLEDGLVLEHGPAPLADAVRAWTDGRGVDVVLDLVGGAYTPASLVALALKGRLMLVGLVAGRSAELDLGRILSSRLTLRGTVLRARSPDEKIAATEAFARDVIPWLAAGRARPVIDTVFPLARIADAHQRMHGNESFGKIVLTVE
jgi:putative PIG3 family NAD(P)H quinone oxidoreductase